MDALLSKRVAAFDRATGVGDRCRARGRIPLSVKTDPGSRATTAAGFDNHGTGLKTAIEIDDDQLSAIVTRGGCDDQP